MGALDGTSHQLGEECDIKGEVEQVGSGLGVSPVDIDCVAQGLEGLERDADRKNDVQGDRIGLIVEEGLKKPGEAGGEEIEVFENPQDSQVHGDGKGTPASGGYPFGGGRDALCDKKVNQGGECDQKQEPRIPGSVEKVACCQKHAILATVGQHAIEYDYHREEDPEEVAVECQLGGV